MFKNPMRVAAAIAAVTTGGIGSAAARPAAGASTDTAAIDVVIVTARKKEESVQTVPVAITVFSGAQLENAHIDTPVDLGRYVPSLTVKNNFALATATLDAPHGVQEKDEESP